MGRHIGSEPADERDNFYVCSACRHAWIGAVDRRFRETSDLFVLTRMICEPKKRNAQYVYARLEERSLIWVKPQAARRHYEFAVTTIFKVE